jgi:starch synthase (maltosyl-transferring)
MMAQADTRAFSVRSAAMKVDAERRAAGFSSWYELFPRSLGPDAASHGTLRTWWPASRHRGHGF